MKEITELYTHMGISPEPRRPYSRLPCIMPVCGEFPYEPQMGEIFQAAECVLIPELFLENDLAGQMLSQTALTRDATLLRKLCPDAGYWPDFHINKV